MKNGETNLTPHRWLVYAIPCLSVPASFAFATIYNVPAGNDSVLTNDMKAAKAGDTIILDGGTYDTGITTSSSGTAAAPITVEGINGATLYGSSSTTGEGIEVNNNDWIFQNLTLNGFLESFRADAASYGIANNITTNNSGIESFKFKNTSTHWLVENCTVNNSGMEGFYCGDASQNWTGGVPDQTSFITFYHDINNINVNDGFDCKEGTSNIRVIDCESNWQGTTPGANDEGDSGAYIRNDNEEVVNYTVLNNASAGNAVRAETATVNGITYGSACTVYGLVANNIQGAYLNTTQPGTTLYTNYSLTNVASGLLESGSQTPAYANPATFTEATWTSAGGAFNEGSLLPINMVWDYSPSAVGNGSTWDYTQQNFVDPGVNGNIPVIFFQGVAVTFNDANNGHYTVNLTGNLWPTSVTVNNNSGNYVFNGGGAIAGPASLTKSGSGTLTLNTTNAFTGPTNVQAGKLILGVSGALPATTNLTIAAGAAVQMSPSIGSDTIASLTLNTDGTLDITNNTLLIAYTGSSPAPTIRGYLQSAYVNGIWTNTGITSSAIAADPGTTIGYLDTGSEIKIKFTWLGDANLDGMVTATDLSAISPTGTTWATGDFNYDGKVNADDYALFMLGAAESDGANISTLPEPAFFAVAGGLIVFFRLHGHALKYFSFSLRDTPSPGTPGEGGGEGIFRPIVLGGPLTLTLSRSTGRGNKARYIQEKDALKNNRASQQAER